MPSNFRQLAAWQRAHQLALDAYRITRAFPATERYNITAQIRRSAVAISSNIAEATGRFGVNDQSRILQIACGSARELESEFLVARNLGFLSGDDHRQVETLIEETLRLVAGLIARRRGMASKRG
jgi:four helix bundle protein